MKLSTTIATSILLATAVATTASAQDKVVPDLLAGINDEAVQEMSPEDEAKTRGERIYTTKTSWGFCGWSVCKKTSRSSHLEKRYGRYGSYYVKH